MRPAPSTGWAGAGPPPTPPAPAARSLGPPPLTRGQSSAGAWHSPRCAARPARQRCPSVPWAGPPGEIKIDHGADGVDQEYRDADGRPVTPIQRQKADPVNVEADDLSGIDGAAARDDADQVILP